MNHASNDRMTVGARKKVIGSRQRGVRHHLRESAQRNETRMKEEERNRSSVTERNE